MSLISAQLPRCLQATKQTGRVAVQGLRMETRFLADAAAKAQGREAQQVGPPPTEHRLNHLQVMSVVICSRSSGLARLALEPLSCLCTGVVHCCKNVNSYVHAHT